MLPKGLFELFLKSKKVCTDTRNLIPGSIFFALKGANFDGNTYALKALEAGCVAAVIDDQKLAGEKALILVEDVLATLQELAHEYRKQFTFPVLGITGSNGKTTSKELIRDVLKSKFKVHATQGNLNNHIGVPLTLLSLPEQTDFAIVEMGANHQKEIEALTAIADPDYGYITNIGKAHLEGFGGSEGVKKGKKELFDHLRLKDGVVFVNTSSPHLMEISEGLKRICFGSPEDEHYFEIQSADPTLLVSWVHKGVQKLILNSQLAGAYNLSNIAAAVVIGSYFGVNPEQISRAIEHYQPDNNRSQWLKTDTNRVIMDAYNANPTSMEAALKNLEQVGKEVAFAIIGDMKELGEDTDKEHLAIVQLMEQLGLDGITVGPAFLKASGTDSRLPAFEDLKAVSDYLKRHPVKDKVVLLKGSRSMKLEELKDLL